MSDEYEVVGNHLGYEEAKTIETLVDETGLSRDEVSKGLRDLMDYGVITSTPDWKYRLARNENARGMFGER